jgi:hypothetical protein
MNSSLAVIGTFDHVPAPIHPIGHRDGKYFFFDRYGQLVELGAHALGQQAPVIALFGGGNAMKWLCERFPAPRRSSRTAFDVAACNNWLVDECGRAGLIDPYRLPVRGQGVWIAGGKLALHLGEHVLFEPDCGASTTMRRTWFADDAALWAPRSAIPMPAPSVSAHVAQQVEQMFSKWCWAIAGGERLFTGLWAAGLLGAAINHRPHGLVIGSDDAGRTDLLHLYGTLSPAAVHSGDLRPAAVIRMMSDRAAPLVLDEAGCDFDAADRVAAVLRLLPRASAVIAERARRGMHAGAGRRVRLHSPAILGAASAPALTPQDAARITRLELVPMPDGAPPLPIDDMLIWSREHTAGLWGRALAGRLRFRENLVAARVALLAHGCSPCLVDQAGTILAARAMILADEALDAVAADTDARALLPALAAVAAGSF